LQLPNSYPQEPPKSIFTAIYPVGDALIHACRHKERDMMKLIGAIHDCGIQMKGNKC
jgi:hypothetical protein